MLHCMCMCIKDNALTPFFSKLLSIFSSGTKAPAQSQWHTGSPSTVTSDLSVEYIELQIVALSLLHLLISGTASLDGKSQAAQYEAILHTSWLPCASESFTWLYSYSLLNTSPLGKSWEIKNCLTSNDCHFCVQWVKRGNKAFQRAVEVSTMREWYVQATHTKYIHKEFTY